MLASSAETKQDVYNVPAGVLGDEKHLLFECPALQDLRDR